MKVGGGRHLLAWVAVSLVAIACTPDRPVDAKPTPPPPTEAAETAAAELRLTLEQGFALHAHLLAESLTTSGKREAAASAAVEANTRDLAGVVAQAYDREASAQFADALDAYSRAMRNQEGGQTSPALDTAVEELATILSDITESTLDPKATTALVADATDTLVETVAAASDRDHETAYELHRESFANMLDTGRAVAAGIIEHLASKYPGPRSGGPLELQSALQQLLGEHSLLAVTATRRGARGAPDFDAAAAALNGNTNDLVRALRSEYGAKVEPFDVAWRGRISALADYAVAVAGDDEDGAAAAAETVTESDDAAARALARLTDGNVAGGKLRAALRGVSDILLASVDTYADERYGPSEDDKVRAYRRSAAVAELVAAGVVAHRPETFAK